MEKLSQQQTKEVRDTIIDLKNQLELYNEKLGNMTLWEVRNNRSAIKEFEKSIKKFLKSTHPNMFDQSFLDKSLTLDLINMAIASLRDLLTKIVALEIETAAENIKEGIEQIKKAREKADESLSKLNDIKKGLQILAKFISLAGAIAVAAAAPNMGTLLNVTHTAGDLIESLV